MERFEIRCSKTGQLFNIYLDSKAARSLMVQLNAFAPPVTVPFTETEAEPAPKKGKGK